jgi:phosphatidylglycerophosphate synthase
MNWPNRITIVRVALIPLIVILLQFDSSVCAALAWSRSCWRLFRTGWTAFWHEV